MPRYVEGSARDQVTLLPECLDDYIADDNPIRVVEAFVEELDLAALGFEGMTPARLPALPDEGTVHAKPVPAHLTLGARGGARSRATQAQ